MTKSNQLRHGRHCVFNMHVHLVFVAKYRRRIFRKEHYDSMKNIFSDICKDFGASLVEMDGENDHVHLLITYQPSIPVSKLVNSLKGVSSRLLKQQHSELRKHYWKGALWSPSYFAASCGGASIDIVRQYIEQQDTP